MGRLAPRSRAPSAGRRASLTEPLPQAQTTRRGAPQVRPGRLHDRAIDYMRGVSLKLPSLAMSMSALRKFTS